MSQNQSNNQNNQFLNELKPIGNEYYISGKQISRFVIAYLESVGLQLGKDIASVQVWGKQDGSVQPKLVVSVFIDNRSRLLSQSGINMANLNPNFVDMFKGKVGASQELKEKLAPLTGLEKDDYLPITLINKYAIVQLNEFLTIGAMRQLNPDMHEIFILNISKFFNKDGGKDNEDCIVDVLIRQADNSRGNLDGTDFRKLLIAADKRGR